METTTARQAVTDSNPLRGLKLSGEHAKQARLQYESCRGAEICGKCGRKIAPGELVGVVRLHGYSLLGPTRRRSVICESCTLADPAYPRYGRTLQCDMCGRPFWEHNWGRRRFKRHAFCCDRCQWSYYNARQAEQRAEARADAECVVCGEPFEPARADALYCSGACRQRAYRERKRQAGVTGSNCPLGGTIAKRNAEVLSD